MLRYPILLLLLVSLVGAVNANVPIDDNHVVDEPVNVDVQQDEEVFEEEVVEAEYENSESGPDSMDEPIFDTDREAIIFKVEQRQSGFTYMDKYAMSVDQEMTIGGMDIKTTTAMEMDSETHVEDLVEGGQSIETTFVHASMAVDAGIMSIECDTDKPDEGEPEEGDSMSNLACAPLNEMVGTTFHFVLDDEGTLVVEDTPMEDGPDLTLGSKQVDQTSRLLKLVPNDVPIKPGDSWDASEDLGSDMGTFSGDGFLKGYTDYNGFDCAVIYLTGSLEMDMKKVIDMMGGGDLPGMDGLTVSEANMDTTIYYDYESNLIRWSQAAIKMTITMPNPMNPDGAPITVPTNEVVTTTTEIKSDE